MASFGWVDVTKKAEEKAINLRRFFEVAKLDLIDKLKIPGIVFRRTDANVTSDYSLAAWAQKARIEARKHKLSPINIRRLELAIPKIREMTVEDPVIFCGELIKLFSKNGIALAFLPHIGGSFLHGATFFDSDHIVMGLTVRGKDADEFWFSFFHEVCHIVRGHINDGVATNDEKELEADAFARDILISSDLYKSFVEADCFTKRCIIDFANKINIAPGIVLGRLQKETKVPYNKYNELKVKYQISC